MRNPRIMSISDVIEFLDNVVGRDFDTQANTLRVWKINTNLKITLDDIERKVYILFRSGSQASFLPAYCYSATYNNEFPSLEPVRSIINFGKAYSQISEGEFENWVSIILYEAANAK